MSERREIEAPSTNLHAPEKCQAPNRKGLVARRQRKNRLFIGRPAATPLAGLEVGVASFFGAWRLDVGAWASMGFPEKSEDPGKFCLHPPG